MVQNGQLPPEMTLYEGDKHPVDPDDQSLFGTRRPRPMGAGRHLLVVLLCFLAALTLAIVYAESTGTEQNGAEAPATSPQP